MNYSVYIHSFLTSAQERTGKKGRAVPVHAMSACRAKSNKAPLPLLPRRWMEVSGQLDDSSICPTGKEPPVTIALEVEGTT